RFQIVEQELVVLVRADNVHFQRFLEVERSPGMVDMAVRDPDCLDVDRLRSNRVQNAVEITARIDHHALLALAVEQNGAILLERRDGNDNGLQLPHSVTPLKINSSASVTDSVPGPSGEALNRYGRLVAARFPSPGLSGTHRPKA